MINLNNWRTATPQISDDLNTHCLHSHTFDIRDSKKYTRVYLLGKS